MEETTLIFARSRCKVMSAKLLGYLLQNNLSRSYNEQKEWAKSHYLQIVNFYHTNFE